MTTFRVFLSLIVLVLASFAGMALGSEEVKANPTKECPSAQDLTEKFVQCLFTLPSMNREPCGTCLDKALHPVSPDWKTCDDLLDPFCNALSSCWKCGTCKDIYMDMIRCGTPTSSHCDWDCNLHTGQVKDA